VPLVCPSSEHTTCDNAAESEIACGGSLSGCLWKTDDKFYKVEGTAGKEVTVTLTHSGESCEQNDLYVYESACGTYIGSSSGRNEVDSWTAVTETDIIVKISGDSRNENCQWVLETDCEDVCEESGSKCSGPFNIDCDQFISHTENCGMRTGGREHISGCLYSDDSKFYSVEFWKGIDIEVKLTNRGNDCKTNSLHIYDGCDLVESVEGDDDVKTWVGSVSRSFNIETSQLKVEVRSNSENKNCLWELDIIEVGDCEGPCVDRDGTDCSPYRCIGGSCSLDICRKGCGSAECDSDNPCEEGWHCSSGCECVEGISRTISMQQGWNLISSPFEEFEIDTDCELDASIFGYNTTDKNYEVVSSLDDMVGGYGYWVKVKENCEIAFVGLQLVTYVDLDAGWNMIGTVNNEEIELDNIKGDCVITASLYKYDTNSENYAVATSLSPGIGYWIKVNDDCTIETD